MSERPTQAEIDEANSTHAQEVEEQEVLKLAEECGAVMLVEMQDRYWRNTGGATFQSAQLQEFAAKLRRMGNELRRTE